MKLRGKDIIKCKLNNALEDFYCHSTSAVISRKAIRFGEHYDNYFSRNISEMSCGNYSIKKRMKMKLQRIRQIRYDYIQSEKYYLRYQKK